MTRSRKRLVAGVVAALAVLAGIAAWKLSGPPNEQPDVAPAISAAVEQAGVGGLLDMRETAPFTWDRMYAFQAYTNDDDVSQVLGFPWGTGEVFRLPNDGFVLLVFADDREVTGWTILNDYESAGPWVLFATGLYRTPIARADSTFTIHASEPGWYRLQLAPAR